MHNQPWSCPTCNQDVATRYCPECGEQPLRPNDLTLRGLFHQVALACTSIDGPLIRSFRCLIIRPGALTAAYLNGQRKPYTLPLQLFLLANVLFFADALEDVRAFLAGADAVAALERKAQLLLAQANAYRELSSSLAHDNTNA